MTQIDASLSTGLRGLDRALKGLIAGDNIVWGIHAIEDYLPFIEPYVSAAIASGKKIIYFRFAKHAPLVGQSESIEVHWLYPEEGFETFITEIHKVIENTEHGAFYIFDCLSDLAADWYSDQMLGNFFLLTCPYLYDVGAIAYFALLKEHHSFHATGPISETAQVLLDVYRHKGRIYVHPLKVQQRYSPTMYMLHVWEGQDFLPVSQSATIAEILTSAPWGALESVGSRMGVWNRTFLEAQELAAKDRKGEAAPDRRDYFLRLVRMAVTREERLLRLVERYLDLGDVLDIGKRMIGTGLIGGKSVGMLLARAILHRSDARWDELLEAHDSFYIGSDVFYTFLVRNGIWWVRQKQKNPRAFLEDAERARQRMLTGTFPDYIHKQFEYMLDYFGQSPIIVRSSSLLEDNFGNAFAGKYESIFCANQGPRHKRLDDFMSAVRSIYASAMSEKALTYRAQRGLLDRDEQMALLVQRVSGTRYGNLFYPQVAGVGFSFNPYAWSEYIEPEAGMVRLVFGLGTRAVDRRDDDYTRVVALNAPDRRPEANFDQVRQYSQRHVDVLDLEGNQLITTGFEEVVESSQRLPVEMFASRDEEAIRLAAERKIPVFPWVLTFEKLFTQTDFVKDMRAMLSALQEAYDYPVDVEFTANFFDNRACKVNLVQCRPLQVKGGGSIAAAPAGLGPQQRILEAHGAVIGQSRLAAIDRLIYVVPEVYGHLGVNERYTVARLIGKLAHLDGGTGAGGTGVSPVHGVDRPTVHSAPPTIMLLGPGRWGTTTPSLGVPVRFGDISTVSVLCEIVAMRDDLVPDVSLGTHFLNELVEMEILYLALFPSKEDNFLNRPFFASCPNRLTDLLPEQAQWAGTVRVIDAADLPDGQTIRLHADTLSQKVVCYLQASGA